MAEYKRQKEELNEYIELEQYLMHEVEQENKIKNTKQEISRFQSRVYYKKFKKKIFINIFCRTWLICEKNKHD